MPARRIAVLAPRAGYFVGGVETFAKELRRHLLDEHDCKIFSLAETEWTSKVPGVRKSKPSPLVRRLRLNYINHLIPYVYIIKPYALQEFTYSYHVYPLLKQYNPDIIINLNFSILALFCRYYRSKFKVPFVNVGQSGCTYMEVKSAMTKPDAYVALTPLAKEYIERNVSGVRVEVIPNGVDTNLFSPKGHEYPSDYFVSKSGDDNLHLNRPFILSTSRLIKAKRLDLLIKAVSRLEKGTLILAGHGEERQRLVDLAQNLLKNRIIFLETLSHEELSKLYRSCDVFSLPSRNEAFGNVIVEAMASGLPVVATHDKGFEWMVGDRGGILVDVTDTQAYAKALGEAYERDFGVGPESQAQRFSWHFVMERYKEMIEECIKES